MTWHRGLIVAAGATAFAVIAYALLLSGTLDIISSFSGNHNGVRKLSPFSSPGTASSFYPFRWQDSERERLRTVLSRPTEPPVATDALGLARYAEFARRNGDEAVLREGMRREPQNALYHYLLADIYIRQGLDGYGPKTDKATGKFWYDYTIKDRKKLDMGMRELAIGMRLPLRNHRDTLLRAQLDAMPRVDSTSDYIQSICAMAAVIYPEFGKMRNFARVNGYYLSLLLAEGKRAEAEPFLHTGERLAVQMNTEKPRVLIGELVALAVAELCKKNDARVCRQYGLTREATSIETRIDTLMGETRAWKGSVNKKPDSDKVLVNHAGVLAGFLLPVFSPSQEKWITPETLRPSRLVEYIVFEGGVLVILATIFFMLLVYAGLHYWRIRIATRGAAPAAGVALTGRDWVRIIAIGYLVPLVIYLLYIATPALSGRDHSIWYSRLQFVGGMLFFVLWTLLVPTTMAAGTIWRRSMAIGAVEVSQRGKTQLSRGVAAFCAFIWANLAGYFLLIPLMCIVLSAVTVLIPPSLLATALVVAISSLVLLGIPLIHARFRRTPPESASHYLALARSMITVYAVFTLLLGALLPVCRAFERHYIQTDRVMGIMNERDNICLTYLEGRLTTMLSEQVRDGAEKLGMAWDE